MFNVVPLSFGFYTVYLPVRTQLGSWYVFCASACLYNIYYSNYISSNGNGVISQLSNFGALRFYTSDSDHVICCYSICPLLYLYMIYHVRNFKTRILSFKFLSKSDHSYITVAPDSSFLLLHCSSDWSHVSHSSFCVCKSYIFKSGGFPIITFVFVFWRLGSLLMRLHTKMRPRKWRDEIGEFTVHYKCCAM